MSATPVHQYESVDRERVGIMETMKASTHVMRTEPYVFGGQRWPVVLSLLIPIGTLVALLTTAENPQQYVELPIYYRVVLGLHAFYFLSAQLCYELFPDGMCVYVTRNPSGRVPRDNNSWAIHFVAGDLMFTTASYYIILAIQNRAPIFALMVPIVQCAYNFRNDIVWMAGWFSPETPKTNVNPFALGDAAFIWAFMVVYIVHYVLATTSSYY
uniref:Uncharacterized protein n=1 Tax=Chromera velia CCMP2878 TaxID=1169474 RepID=A0A0G4F254_9ALVE|eukprot:Cvel_14823.t1-p1 / transcript=Cvel_14823.t1 / gene=Cvel_14823 / organism=Chromera_velia_CCMP2878 / gene_product=hypothetical protein / transcript_product=hypothetical protein / location=Cvel_scaffold1069:54373-55008(+) / protein_length=212 / sequence_SO=supercontig / SO=protein_coding / is_pseudo=false